MWRKWSLCLVMGKEQEGGHQLPLVALLLPLTTSSTCGPGQTVLKQNLRMETGMWSFSSLLASVLPHILSLILTHIMTCLSPGPQVVVLLQCPGRNSRETHQDQHYEHEQAKQAVFPGHGPFCAYTALPATLGAHSRPSHI
jgi:hypothetical protein